MAIYEYECSRCEHKFEVRQGIFHKEKAKCPNCGSEDVKRRYSSFGYTSGGSCSPRSFG